MDFNTLSTKINRVHTELKNRSKAAVNSLHTLRNWMIGYYIVTYEQDGSDRAKYGDQFLAALAKDLKSKGIKGLSKRNLHYFCQFYLMYPATVQSVTSMSLPRLIVQTVSAQSEMTKKKTDKTKVDPGHQ